LQGGDEGAVGFLLLVPPSQLARKTGTNEDFIDGSEEPNPGESPRECGGVVGKKLGPLGILKITDPIRHAEVTEVNDRLDFQRLELTKGFIGERPVVFHWPLVSAIVRPAIADVIDSHLLDQANVLPPEIGRA